MQLKTSPTLRWNKSSGAQHTLNKYLVFLCPLLITNILQAVSSTLNVIYVGQLLGTPEVAAVSGIFPIVFFFITIITGLGAGASVLIGQAWGGGKLYKVQQIAGTTLTVCVSVGLTIAIAGWVFTNNILNLLNTPANIMSDARLYTRITMLTLPLTLTSIVYTQFLRAVGDSFNPFMASLVMTIINITFTPALICGWLGMPRLGIISPALSNFAAMILSNSYLAIRLNRGGHLLAFNRELFKVMQPDKAVIRRVLRIGLPSSLQMVVVSLAELAILSIINKYGSDATAAYGAVTQVINYIIFPAISVAIAASVLTSHAIGASQIKNIDEILRTGLILSFAFIGSLVAIGYAFSETIIGVFITGIAARINAVNLLKITIWGMIPFALQAVISGIMRASGSVVAPTTITILCIIFVLLPAAYFGGVKNGQEGVWAAYPISFSTMLIMELSYFIFIWRKTNLRLID